MLERVVPPQGAVIDGFAIPSGTIVGVNAWLINFNKEVFGNDVDIFRPDRWLDTDEHKITEMRRTLFSVSIGTLLSCPQAYNADLE